jgi:hypothetical protein
MSNTFPLVVQHLLLPDDIAGRIDHCAEDAGNKTLFVSCLGSDCVAVVDLFAGITIFTIRDKSIHRPQGLYFHNSILAVASVKGITLCTLDRIRSSFAVTQFEVLEVEECDNIRMWRKGSSLCLVGLGEGSEGTIGYLSLGSVAAGESRLDSSKSVSLGCHPEGFTVCSESGDVVAVNAPDRRCVFLLGIDPNTMSQSLLSEFPLPGDASHNFPICAESNTVFVGLRHPHQVLKLQIVTPANRTLDSAGAIISLVESGHFCLRGCDSDDIFIHGSSRKVFVVNGSGSLDIFEMGSVGECIYSVPTAIGARTGWLSHSRKKLYVCVPRSASLAAHVLAFDLL